MIRIIYFLIYFNLTGSPFEITNLFYKRDLAEISAMQGQKLYNQVGDA